MSDPEILEWLTRIEAEYREMPGLLLTERQMQRLWGLDGQECADLVAILVARGVLRARPTRASGWSAPRFCSPEPVPSVSRVALIAVTIIQAVGAREESPAATAVVSALFTASLEEVSKVLGLFHVFPSGSPVCH